MVFAVSAKAQQKDFTGTWTRNTEQCDPGELSVNSIPVTLSAKQAASILELTRTSKNKAGETTVYTEKLGSDGSLSSVQVKSGLNKKASIKWAADGQSLTISADYTDDQGNPVQKITEVWALSADGKHLTIDRTDVSDGEEFKLKEVFDRQ